ncbi:hypothetical protein CPAR01_00445 [Colletotrichum paranaense]|uniref:Uncharacterized protein n=1 Tax=Colletotrichum paranaense TaxID=1914294 RepID=A0ABQ9T3W8_9PEZI|nr:uncharacterized protein CPAR01_00445 [Colletotrichum paranaense]KAK1546478.1 hypothetical protein CPAR01_00445 [Colletotrichum paranaense]
MQPPIAQGNSPISQNEEAKEIQDAINTILETAQKTHEPSEKMPDSPINAPRLSRDDMDETELNSEFAWDIATKLHAKNFVRLVSRKPPVLHTIYRLLNKLQMGDWGYRVNIAEMQRMHLRALQVGLVDKAVEMQVRGNAMGPEAIAKDGKLLAGLPREYTQAVQDYEYMTKVSQQPFDFFVASSERYQDSYVLDKVMRKNRVGARAFADPPRMTYESMKLHALPTGPWSSEENPEPLGGTRNASAKAVLRRNFGGRLWAQWLEGLSLSALCGC